MSGAMDGEAWGTAAASVADAAACRFRIIESDRRRLLVEFPPSGSDVVVSERRLANADGDFAADADEVAECAGVASDADVTFVVRGEAFRLRAPRELLDPRLVTRRLAANARRSLELGEREIGLFLGWQALWVGESGE